MLSFSATWVSRPFCQELKLHIPMQLAESRPPTKRFPSALYFPWTSKRCTTADPLYLGEVSLALGFLGCAVLEGPRGWGRLGYLNSHNVAPSPIHWDYYTLLYYTILYYTILYYTILYYTILYYTILYSTLLYSTLLYYTILYYTILYYTILCYTIL